MARILVVLAVLLAVLLAAPPAHAADAVVGSGTPASCTEAAFDTALAAVQAGAGGTLTFHCGGAATILFTAQKTITGDVTVDGAGTVTLNGGQATRLFRVNNTGRLTLHRITLINGRGNSGDGGAIDNRGSLTLTQATLRDNSTPTAYSGGAIVSYGPLTISDSLFENNSAGSGGALYTRFENAEATVSGSTFRHNRTTQTDFGWGGAILLWDGADLTVWGSHFDGNQANQGGAIHSAFATSHVKLEKGTTLRDNTADNSGGGLYSAAGSTTLTDVTLHGNRAFGSGGGLTIVQGLVTLTAVTLGGNSASGSGGGMTVLEGSVTLTDVTISGNSADDSGGGMTIAGGVVTMAGVTFRGNAAAHGGGINMDDGAVSVTNVTLSGNSAVTGGGFSHIGGVAALTNVTFSGNSAGGAGGGIWHAGQAGEVTRLRNVLLARDSNGGNCYQPPGSGSAITSDGFNLSSDQTCSSVLYQIGDQNGTDPRLGPLADNGGPTWTHLPLADSPAVDGGQCGAGPAIDQRGGPRVQGAACDIGAVERRPGDKGFFLRLPAVLKR